MTTLPYTWSLKERVRYAPFLFTFEVQDKPVPSVNVHMIGCIPGDKCGSTWGQGLYEAGVKHFKDGHSEVAFGYFRAGVAVEPDPIGTAE